MRHAFGRLLGGAAAIGFALFGVLLIGLAVVIVVNGSPLGLLLPGGIGIAAVAAAWETWSGRRFRFRPVVIVGAFVLAYLVLAVIALQNIGP